MLTRSDTGLTLEQYDYLQTLTQYPAVKVVAHKANLEFAEQDTSSSSSSSGGDDYDAVVSGAYLYRITSDLFERCDLSTGTWSTVPNFTFPADTRIGSRPTLTKLSDGRLAAFLITDSGLQRNLANTASNDSWGGWWNILSDTQTVYRYSGNLVDTATGTLYKSSEDASYPALDAFESANYGWKTASGNTTGWISWNFVASHEVRLYSVRAPEWSEQDWQENAEAPKSWTLQYWAGSAWITAHTVTGQVNWASGEQRHFYADASASATAWRLNITANNGSTAHLAIGFIEFMEYAGTLASVVTAVSALTDQRLHYVEADYDRHLFQLCHLEWDTGLTQWVKTESGIYWPYEINNMSAVTLDPDEDIDVILIDSQVPGNLTTVSEDNEAVNYLYTSGGILAFRYQYGTWSDHIEVDVVDDLQDWRYRRRVFVTNLNGTIFATCYSSDGTEKFPVEGFRCYTSKDGLFWSRGQLLDIPYPPEDGAIMNRLDALKLVADGDTIYGLERKSLHRAVSTVLTGYSSPQTQFDLTTRLLSYNLNHQGMLSASMTLANDDGWLDNHAIINSDNTVTFEHFAGFYPEDTATWGTDPLLVQIGITEMDAYGRDEDLVEDNVQIVARDRLAWMSEKAVSEQADYWQSQLIGADNYADRTGTNYGGLSHTAAQLEIWKTENDFLYLDANEKIGVSFSTFGSDLWNGDVQMSFVHPAASSAGTWAGIVFRALDKDNYWLAYYIPSTDAIQLVERRNATWIVPVAAQVTAIGWGQTDNLRHLRVKFHYGNVTIYTSNDGVTWTERINYLLDYSGRRYGAPYLKKVGETFLERGYAGVAGTGKL